MVEEVEQTESPSSPGLSSRVWLSPLTGLAQVMFQNSPLTGIFFLLGIAVASPLMALGAAIGAVSGTLTAFLLRFDREEILEGFYGFNASLVGIAVLFRYQPAVLTFVFLVVGAILSTPLTRAMRQRIPFPTYTAPFVLVTWLAYFVAHELHVSLVVMPAQTGGPEDLNIASAVVTGISEVMFQANSLTGVFFLVGILLCSPQGAAWAVIGSTVGLLTGVSEHASTSALGIGIYGYNGALAAMGMALYRPSILLPIFAAALSVPITDNIPSLGLAALTAPFVLACWITIGVDYLDAKIYSRSTKQIEQ